MTTTNKPLALPDHTRTLCRSCILSALRSALACTIVGVATLYAPFPLRRHLKFPAFAYVTAMLIVGDATLGDSLRGAAFALYGTILGLLPALMTFYIIQPEKISAGTTALAVAISSFAVAVLDSTALIAKRVALGQIVIVYVTAFKEAAAGDGKPVLHPVPVAASTAVGALAAVVALVVPYPRLACYEVREKSKLYAEITMERLRLLVNAFCADNNTCMVASISRAKCLTVTCNKLLRDIKLLQGSTQWERPPVKFLPPYMRVSWERLKSIEIPLKGMELALASTSSPPIKTLTLDDQIFKENMTNLINQLRTKLINEHKNDHDHTIDKTYDQSFYAIIPQNLQDLPFSSSTFAPLFFLFCTKLLYDDDDETLISQSPNRPQERKVTPTTTDINASSSCKDQNREMIRSIWSMSLTTEKIAIGLKCSLSLGLAVLFGILYSKDNGYWSGLMVATSFTPFKEATFRSASARAQGTALGSVYGVLGSFISQNLMEVRLLVLIPWVFFTSFLHRSRMYGQVGAIAAATTAMIILGRRKYGSPMIFSIQRLTEAYMGLCCAIFVELALQPTRSSTLARARLAGSLQALDECIESITSSSSTTLLKENEKKLRKKVNELKKYIGEAELEPNFWFLPFPSACYSKLHSSISKIGDLLVFLARGLEVLDKESSEIEESIKVDLVKFKDLVGGLVKGLEEVIQVKSLERLEKELERKRRANDNFDLEVGKGSKLGPWANWAEWDKVVDSFVEHGKDIVERADDGVSGGEEVKTQLVLCYAAIGFCMGGLVREVREMEMGILELVQWENPSSHIDLYEISCKIKNVST